MAALMPDLKQQLLIFKRQTYRHFRIKCQITLQWHREIFSQGKDQIRTCFELEKKNHVANNVRKENFLTDTAINSKILSLLNFPITEYSHAPKPDLLFSGHEVYYSDVFALALYTLIFFLFSPFYTMLFSFLFFTLFCLLFPFLASFSYLSFFTFSFSLLLFSSLISSLSFP